MKGETGRRRRGDRSGGDKTWRGGFEKENVGPEFFTHNVKLLITALEQQPHGETGPADCDLGSTALGSELSNMLLRKKRLK